jgi:hypothetical protein
MLQNTPLLLQQRSVCAGFACDYGRRAGARRSADAASIYFAISRMRRSPRLRRTVRLRVRCYSREFCVLGSPWFVHRVFLQPPPARYVVAVRSLAMRAKATEVCQTWELRGAWIEKEHSNKHSEHAVGKPAYPLRCRSPEHGISFPALLWIFGQGDKLGAEPVQRT